MDLATPDATLVGLRHPGIASLSEVPEGPLLADVALGLEEVAAVFAVLATTLADLRDLGVSLGPLRPSAVVLAPDGRPVITDLTGVVPAGRAPGQESAEVRDLGRMLAVSLRRLDPGQESAGRPHRWGRGWRRRPRSLAEEVQRWTAAAERGTPTLRQLADGLVHPEARLPGPDARREHRGDPEVSAFPDEPAEPPADARPWRWRRAAVTPAQVGSRWRWRRAAVTPAHARPRWWRWPAVTILAATGVVLTGAGVAGWRAPTRPRIATTTRPDPDGAALCLAFTASGLCAAPATYAAGVLRSPTGRFAVGRPADVLAAGRWSCRPNPTLALLRPDRGEVWMFPGWPGRGAPPVAARLATRIAQARLLSVRQVGGCDALVVTRADGTSVVLEPATLR